MDRTEVEVPYVYGPLDGQRELVERWEFDDPENGRSEGYVYEHRPALLCSGADPRDVYRYVLTKRFGEWEFRYEPDLDIVDVPVDPQERSAHLAGALGRLREPATPDDPGRIRARIAQLREQQRRRMPTEPPSELG